MVEETMIMKTMIMKTMMITTMMMKDTPAMKKTRIMTTITETLAIKVMRIMTFGDELGQTLALCLWCCSLKFYSIGCCLLLFLMNNSILVKNFHLDIRRTLSATFRCVHISLLVVEFG